MSPSPSILLDGRTPALDMTYWYFALLPEENNGTYFFTFLAFWEKEKDSR
jgi:hypothetical protein